jgi:hypothetical protein
MSSANGSPHIEDNFVVFFDDQTLEIVGVQPGPAGSIGVSCGNGVEVDLDGAEVSQMNAVRVWHEGSIAPEQISVLETLFADLTEGILQAAQSDRPVRVGRSARRLSSQRQMVSQELSGFVHASDALERIETPSGVRPLLQFAVAVHGFDVGLPVEMPLVSDVALAAAGLSRDALWHFRSLVSRATALGLVSDADASILLNQSRRSAFPDPLLVSRSSVSPVSAPALLNQLSVDVHRAELSVVVDPSGLFANKTKARWTHQANIAVTVDCPFDASMQLWARARHDGDGTVVAAAPLLPDGSHVAALLLVAERDHVVVDVVSHVSARVLSGEVGALGRAFEAGRRAARLERLGLDEAAARAWDECAVLHGRAGDFQRQKLAMSRGVRRGMFEPASLMDHLL